MLNHQIKISILNSTLFYSLLYLYPFLAYAELSDFERFQFPETLKKETVLFLPVRDLRPLFDQQEVKQTSRKVNSKSVEQAITQFWKPLKNIRILSHSHWFQKQAPSPRYVKLLALARKLVRQGVHAYHIVELDRASSQLKSALEVFHQINQIYIDPEEVAHVHLTLGLIALESQQPLHAGTAFQSALLLNPKLRLRKAFDGEKAYNIFEEVRTQLVRRTPDELSALVYTQQGGAIPFIRSASHYSAQLALTLLPTSVHSLLILERSVEDTILKEKLIDKEALNRPKRLNEHLNRLAFRLWSCLPYRRKKKSRSLSLMNRWELDVGWINFIFLDAPVSIFNHTGLTTHLSVPFLSLLRWNTGGGWTVSNRDQQEHLRQDLTSFYLYTGPAWQKRSRAFDFSVGVSLEIRSLSQVILTREVGCKFFDGNDVPSQICHPPRDLRTFKPVMSLGTRIDLSFALALASDLALVLNPSLSQALYTTQTTSFRFPLGGSVKLKYRF